MLGIKQLTDHISSKLQNLAMWLRIVQ